MTTGLKRHGVLGQIIDQTPPYVINVDYPEGACVHLGNQLTPRQTRLAPNQLKSVTLTLPAQLSSAAMI